MSIYELFTSKGPSGFGYGSTAEQVTAGLSLRGKTMLVTGCNSGLGYETMRVLALRGARVVGTARTVGKAKEACDSVQGETVPVACELSDPASVRACVAAVQGGGLRLDAIICNAGIMALPTLQKAYGYELQFFTNHIGHFILVTGLLDQLTETGRVVMLSSTAHRRAPEGGIQFDNLDGSKGYNDWANYGQSKFANILFARELSRRLAGTERTANAVHPGVIKTNLTRHSSLASIGFAIAGPLALKSIPQGAATQVYVATHPTLAAVTGRYFADCNLAPTRPDVTDVLARRLWDVSETIVAGLPAGG
jgi:NAD(P)-dependent dehydrogenase (short-subunit alcohol dehydrogenase family)